MNVLVIRNDPVEVSTSGGAYSHTTGVIKGFLKNGCNVDFVGFINITGEHSSFTNIQLKTKNLPSTFFTRLLGNFSLLREIKKLCEKKKYDFIYSRLCLNDLASLKLKRSLNTPLVTEFNGSEVWIAKNWSKSRNPLLFISKIIERKILLKSDVIIALSKALKEDLLKIGIPENKILLNHNSVDEDLFRNIHKTKFIRKKLNIPQEAVVIGYSGSFAICHAVDVLAKAAVKVSKKNKNLFFVFVGDGKRRKEVEDILREGKMIERCRFTGMVSHRESVEIMSICDILVASFYFGKWGLFGLSVKLFEYMAAGKAIISSDVGEIGEIIRDGENGLKFKEGDFQELAEKILLLAEDENLRKSLGKKAREESMSKYTWRAHCKRILDFLHKKNLL